MSLALALRLSALALLAHALTACTSTALRSSTISVGGTVGSILEQQALQNLGRFVDDHHAIPSHLIIGSGVVEVVNTAVPSIKETTTHAAANMVAREMLIPLTLTWKENWITTPVVSSNDLGKLQDHYKDAVTDSRADDAPGGCPGADKNKWLCVDPSKPPNKLIYKGIYSRHSIWVDSEGFSAFVFMIPELAEEASTKAHKMMQLQFIQ